MSVNAIQPGSGQQLQDEVLSLIRMRSRPQDVATSGAPAPTPAQPSAPAHAQEAVAQINRALQAMGTDLHFQVDHDSREVVVKVVDRGTGEVLRQIPSEATLQIARSLDRIAGHLVDHRI